MGGISCSVAAVAKNTSRLMLGVVAMSNYSTQNSKQTTVECLYSHYYCMEKVLETHTFKIAE